MSNISILDIAELNNNSLLTELSETELQVAGGGHKKGRGGCYGGGRGSKSSKKGRGSKSSKKGRGSKSGRGGYGCHPCW
jgi:hypothetical protein